MAAGVAGAACSGAVGAARACAAGSWGAGPAPGRAPSAGAPASEGGPASGGDMSKGGRFKAAGDAPCGLELGATAAVSAAVGFATGCRAASEFALAGNALLGAGWTTPLLGTRRFALVFHFGGAACASFSQVAPAKVHNITTISAAIHEERRHSPQELGADRWSCMFPLELHRSEAESAGTIRPQSCCPETENANAPCRARSPGKTQVGPPRRGLLRAGCQRLPPDGRAWCAEAWLIKRSRWPPASTSAWGRANSNPTALGGYRQSEHSDAQRRQATSG